MTFNLQQTFTSDYLNSFFADIMYKVKNKADSVSKKIQTKVDTAKARIFYSIFIDINYLVLQLYLGGNSLSSHSSWWCFFDSSG